MSGKLIMKRKLDKEQSQIQQPLQNNTANEPTGSTNSRPLQFEEDNDNGPSKGSTSKRLRCETPPPELENDEDLLPQFLDEANNDNFFNNQRNRHLLEAIQSKVLELQQELDEFEQDFGVNEEDFYNVTAPQQAEICEQEAEALGYAMCAQETMLFLQREGVPSDSILYTRLRDALVGRREHDRAFQI